MKNSILYLVFVALFFTACEKIGLEENANDITYLSFQKDSLTNQDSVPVSFLFYAEDVISFPVVMQINGRVPTENAEYKLTVVTDSTDLKAANYDLPDKVVFRAGRLKDTAYITFTNSPELKQRPFTLCLEIDGMGNFEQGPKINRRLRLIVTDQVTRPAWWQEVPEGTQDIIGWYYLGEYSDKKYELLLEVNDFADFGEASMAERRMMALKLKRYIEKWNADHPEDILKDEKGLPIVVPVAG